MDNMKTKICMIIFLITSFSCQKKEVIVLENEQITPKIEFVGQNIISKDVPLEFNIKSIEGYHMYSETIIKLVVEDEIIYIQIPYFEDEEIKYTDIIITESENINYSEDDNIYNLSQYSSNDYYFSIKINGMKLDPTSRKYEYLGKDITDEIIAVLKNQKNEYTGNYVYSRMESNVDKETLFIDINYPRYHNIDTNDLENSYIFIGLTGNGKMIIRFNDKMRYSAIGSSQDSYVEFDIVFDGNDNAFGYHTGDSMKQGFQTWYYFNDKDDLIVHIEINNWPPVEDDNSDNDNILSIGKHEYKIYYTKRD